MKMKKENFTEKTYFFYNLLWGSRAIHIKQLFEPKNIIRTKEYYSNQRTKYRLKKSCLLKVCSTFVLCDMYVVPMTA